MPSSNTCIHVTEGVFGNLVVFSNVCSPSNSNDWMTSVFQHALCSLTSVQVDFQ